MAILKPSDITITINTAGLSQAVINGIATAEAWFNAALQTWAPGEDWRLVAFPYAEVGGYSAMKETALGRLMEVYASAGWTVQPRPSGQTHYRVAFGR